jgi:hypothetical protein
MKRALVVAIAAAVVAGVTSCAASGVQTAAQSQRIAISADLPPAPTTWPKYPHFSRHSCWGRPFMGDIHRISQIAPSYAPTPRTHPIAPAGVARRLLARLGDRRYVHAIRFWPAHPKHVRSWYAGGGPPAGALRARIIAPAAKTPDHPSPERSLAAGIAQYEGNLVGAALRDDMCDAGGAPLVMWGATGDISGFAESGSALDQRFPNPTPSAFRKRLALVGRRFGFTVASLRLLRPRQLAPLLVVKTNRPRKAFVKDAGRIIGLLDPVTSANHRVAETFEGFFFAAEDARGPFFFSHSANRHNGYGSTWTANACLLPTFGRVGPGTPCP